MKRKKEVSGSVLRSASWTSFPIPVRTRVLAKRGTFIAAARTF